MKIATRGRGIAAAVVAFSIVATACGGAGSAIEDASQERLAESPAPAESKRRLVSRGAVL